MLELKCVDVDLLLCKYEDISFSPCFTLKGNKICEKRPVILMYIYMDFLFTFFILPVIFQQSGKKRKYKHI